MEDGGMGPGSSSIFILFSMIPHLERMLAAASLQSSKAKTILALVKKP
jgi:hypothetical protein